ncbi:MAG: sigma-54-dependent Fis family transcriptional regulator [Myxococcales bacterium]|nr:sigma 54-interacting transcriptional regulator [Deltaproteobacteria bacterium]NNL26741.1 sigma-54-dependent Fis family transcriptional regulator [Myxococcales bacterium]RZV54491.1 MAG: sigma-54-dependent Fis family transcriptional regulator [Deltaproteobacteria bacterium]
MRIPRLLTILGPASVLYVLAARASSNATESPDWLLALLSLAFSLTPLAVLGTWSSRRGASRLAFMGVSLAIALASARSASPTLDVTHDLAWLLAVMTMIDLVLPRETGALVRYGALSAFASAAFAGAALARQGLLPEMTFAVIVVLGILATGALHQIVLVGRGHVVEGGLSGIALSCLAVALAYCWFGPFDGVLAATVELGVASLLWLGHLAWLDPGWRSLRRVGVPVVVASALCFGLTVVFTPDAPLERWQLGLFAVGSGVLWWLTFAFVRRLSARAVWSTSGRLADAAESARGRLVGGAALEEVATGVLTPFSKVFDPSDRPPELYTLEPSLRLRLDTGERANIRRAEAPSAVTRALSGGDRPGALDLAGLRVRVVREPSIRELVNTMTDQVIGCALPCLHLDHLEGVLVLPLGDRSERLSRTELDELGSLADSLGGALASALAQRRADTHIHELSTLRREAEDRIAALESALDDLRGQCDMLGRGLAEDRTLHVAYSQSMRRVQTRAIELAPGVDPILLVAPAGAPVLPVCRFIHDRGPRWEAPFVVADCSAAPPDQVAGLLFGSQSGGRAGWFHSAAGGTLLLRDLPALSKSNQARLAEALADQDSRVQGSQEAQRPRPRLIATTRAPLAELAQRDAIDPELARQISRPGLEIPPLRDRREDVPSLALLAIDRACRVLAREPVGITEDAMTALVDHDWPGDVAELELIIELAVANAAAKTIALSDLPPLAWPGAEEEEPLTGTYVEVERRLLERALLRSGGNKSEAARMLGLKRTTFLDKLRRHELERRAQHDLGGTALG